MNVAPLYRSALRKLHEVSQKQPHFLYELRFLLSLPVTFDGPHTTAGASRAASSEASGSAPSPPPRPATECWQQDLSPDELFALCKADLRQVIDEKSLSPTTTTTNTSPASIVQQVSGLRELAWLTSRLDATLSETTRAALDLAMSISAGPNDDDFIPDTAFAKAEVDRQTHLAMSDHGDLGALQSSAEEKLNQFQYEATPGGTYAMVDEKPSPRGSIDEREPDRLYSAGAVGLHREMFVLRHRDTAFLPMRRYFLHGLDTVSISRSKPPVLSTAAADLRTGTASVSFSSSSSPPAVGASPAASTSAAFLSQAKAAELAVSRLPTARVARNEEVKLTVDVRPFDEEYINRGQAGIGYFESAHRQFMVSFRLEPLAHQQALRVVNTQFSRLDMTLSELVEETGYLHSRDVKDMIQERDAAMGIVSQIASTTLAPEDSIPHESEEEQDQGARSRAPSAPGVTRLSEHRTTSTPGEAEHDDDGAAAVPPTFSGATASSACTAVRDFSLTFVTDSDGPTVLKGLLYYQAAMTEEALVATPIHVIAFSHVLLNP